MCRGRQQTNMRSGAGRLNAIRYPLLAKISQTKISYLLRLPKGDKRVVYSGVDWSAAELTEDLEHLLAETATPED